MGEGNYAVPVVDSIKSMNVIKDASLVRVGGHGPDSESDEEFEDVQEQFQDMQFGLKGADAANVMDLPSNSKEVCLAKAARFYPI